MFKVLIYALLMYELYLKLVSRYVVDLVLRRTSSNLMATSRARDVMPSTPSSIIANDALAFGATPHLLEWFKQSMGCTIQ